MAAGLGSLVRLPHSSITLPKRPIRHLWLQYDSSKAIVGGYDLIAFLEKVNQRGVTMHAADRSSALGATLEELRQADGTIGYSDKLHHGETGQGLNDDDAIFRILTSVGFSGWISVEDGMDGLDELSQPLARREVLSESSEIFSADFLSQILKSRFELL